MAASFGKEFGWLAQLLRRLSDKSHSMWRKLVNPSGDPLGKNTIDNYEALSYVKHPMSPEALENRLAEDCGNLRLNIGKAPFFYLPPLERNSEFIIILSLKCDLDKSLEDINLGIEMYRFDDSKKPLGFGFRFEGPEADSKDDYWHAQVISEARAGGDKLPECPNWLPTTVPCIPARAHCPVSLLFCMLISLYGKGMFNKFFVGMNIDRKFTQPLSDIL